MVARDSLILAAAESGERPTIQRADDVRDVLAVVVGGASNLVRSGYRSETKLRGWNHESLVDVYFRAGRMVDRHERDAIVVVDLPQLRCDAQVVISVMRNKLIAPDFVPLARSRYLCRSQRVDAQSNRRAPRHCVLDEFHLRAVPREKKWTGRFQPLFGDNFLVRLHSEFRAHCAVRPNDPHHFRARLVAKTKVKLWPVDRLLLDQQA